LNKICEAPSSKRWKCQFESKFIHYSFLNIDSSLSCLNKIKQYKILFLMPIWDKDFRCIDEINHYKHNLNNNSSLTRLQQINHYKHNPDHNSSLTGLYETVTKGNSHNKQEISPYSNVINLAQIATSSIWEKPLHTSTLYFVFTKVTQSGVYKYKNTEGEIHNHSTKYKQTSRPVLRKNSKILDQLFSI